MRWQRNVGVAFAISLVVLTTATGAEPASLKLELRSRTQPFKGSDEWQEFTLGREFKPSETAVVICDMWDKHWCDKATERCGVLAEKMEVVVKDLRARGVLIIHAPSECMDHYKDAKARQRVLGLKKVEPPKGSNLIDPELPIDAKEGGCDDEKPVKSFKAWSKQHPAITISDEDAISDQGSEIYSLMQERGIKNLLVMGVHTNMCILNRSFGIKQMTRWGVRCVLVRDLTDAMYNPKKSPFVKHEEGTELVIQHIEKYWCPSVLSSDLKAKK